jgi:glycosyltransferase involved in cell wall biosynthesis
MRDGNKIIVDAREFVLGRFTGIARVACGLIRALAKKGFIKKIILATFDETAVPDELQELSKIDFKPLPRSFLYSEKALSDLSGKGSDLFLSPYPKLPLFGCICRSVHIIHDVHYITHSVKKGSLKTRFDIIRLKRALNRAHLTWYDSNASLQETLKLTQFAGKKPKVRYPGLSQRFSAVKKERDAMVLAKYNLKKRYILVVGNGHPHKNLGVLLSIETKLARPLVFVGVSQENQKYWLDCYPRSCSTWITFVEDNDLPALYRSAFCLAQPSLAEGYGYPPLEAMASSIPAVVSDIPVLRETTAGNALQADPKLPQDWINAIEALEDTFFYQSQQEKGLKWTRQFVGPKTWDHYVQDIEDLLETDG